MSLRSAIATFRGHRQFHMDIIGRRRLWFAISGLLVVLSIGSLFIRGLNLGIDFRGGTQLVYPNPAGVSTTEVRETMARFGYGDSVVQVVDDSEVSVRTGDLGDRRADVTAALAEQAGIDAGQVNAQVIGPRWGEQISRKALQGLIIFLVVVSIYIAMRFEWKMSVAAITALFHDLIITTGIYSLSGREVTPETVIAILTILGYSLYDTVVIFDKIRDNAASPSLVAKETYAGAVNLSLNQVFMRSVNTSITTLLPIGTLLLFGGETLQNFAFALFVGVALGAYSSIFVAAPLLTTLKEREPRLAQLRERARARRPELAAVPGGADVVEADVVEAPAPRSGSGSRGATPAARPRRPKKKPRAKRKKR
ncbi:MAG TPA: protein translocase subunit SecF [Actinomycetota bacterium]|nr:protein translocase subunit SecF [Actinomycetota bacterium]